MITLKARAYRSIQPCGDGNRLALNSRESREASNFSWSIAYDPDGTLEKGSRFTQEDIYFGLKLDSFSPRTVLFQHCTDGNGGRRRTWWVAPHVILGQPGLDAYTYIGRGGQEQIMWLRDQPWFHPSIAAREKSRGRRAQLATA